MTDTIKTRVARGARLLDEREPGWFNLVDVDRIDMLSLTVDVLGQTWKGPVPAWSSPSEAHYDVLFPDLVEESASRFGAWGEEPRRVRPAGRGVEARNHRPPWGERPMTAPAPTRDEIGPNEIFVQVHTKPDNQGRVMFTAFWLDNDLPPNGVRGQVFRTSLEKFMARSEKAGEKVCCWNPKENTR